MNWNKLIINLVIFSILLTSSGCWGRRETDDLAIVGAIALDAMPDDKILVTAEVVNPLATARGTEVGGEAATVAWLMREESNSVGNAISNMQRRSPRFIFMGQINTVIFGQNLARRGIRPYLDFFSRHGDFRRSLNISVCDSGSGLLQRPFMEDLPSRVLDGLMLAAPSSSRTATVDLNEFLRSLSEPGIEPIAMHTVGRETEELIIKQIGEEVQQEDPAPGREEPLDSDKNLPGMLPDDSPHLDPIPERATAERMPGMTIMIGLAAFLEDQLVGFLDGIDARGFLWLKGRMDEGWFELSEPFWNRGNIGMQLVRINSDVEPVVKDGALQGMRVNVAPDFQIAEVTQRLLLGDTDVIDQIENSLNAAIEAEIQNTLDIVQEDFRSDIYGFGQTIYRNYPEVWEPLEGNWNDEHFPDLEVNITVDSRIRMAEAILRD